MRLLATLALLGTLAVTALAGAAGPPSGLARFREQQLSYGSLGTFPGATEVWRSRILLIGRAQPVGYATMACIYVVDNWRECRGTVILPTGRVAAAGALTSRSTFELVIVGGTGAYDGAKGRLTAVGTAETRVLTFNFGV